MIVESTTTRTADTAGTGGQAGFARQQPNQSMSLANTPTGGSKEEENGSKTEATSIPSGKQTDIVKVGMTPIMATGVDRHSLQLLQESLGRLDNPPAAGKDQKEPDAAALAPIRKQDHRQGQEASGEAPAAAGRQHRSDGNSSK